jgi:hypothetical protein
MSWQLTRSLAASWRTSSANYGQHDEHFRIVFEAIRQLMAPPAEPEKKGRIGFVRDGIAWHPKATIIRESSRPVSPHDSLSPITSFERSSPVDF